jgi:hypothetical protein
LAVSGNQERRLAQGTDFLHEDNRRGGYGNPLFLQKPASANNKNAPGSSRGHARPWMSLESLGRFRNQLAGLGFLSNESSQCVFAPLFGAGGSGKEIRRDHAG